MKHTGGYRSGGCAQSERGECVTCFEHFDLLQTAIN